MTASAANDVSTASAAVIVGVEIVLTHIFNRLHEKALVDRAETIASLIDLHGELPLQTHPKTFELLLSLATRLQAQAAREEGKPLPRSH